MIRDLLLVMLTSAAPISELRGGIPLGVALGLEPALVFVLAVIANMAVFWPGRLALVFCARKVFCRIPYFDVYLERVQRRGRPKVQKYGFLGLVFIVALPLPITGAYTGTVLSWLLGLNWMRSFLSISVGIIVAGIIVMLATMGVISIATVG